MSGSSSEPILLSPPDSASNQWLTALAIDEVDAGMGATEVISHLESRNIECRPLWKPMHQQPVFAGGLAYTNGVAESPFTRGVTLPSGSVHGPEAIGRVCAALDELKERTQ